MACYWIAYGAQQTVDVADNISEKAGNVACGVVEGVNQQRIEIQ